MKSRCTQPRLIPLEWREFYDFTNLSFMAYRSWLLDLPIARRQIIEAEIGARKDAAAVGQITEEMRKTFEPVRTQPGIFELKWEHKSFGQRFQIRQYHGEPIEMPELLVATHIHLKDIKGTKVEIDRKQDLEMDFAHKRFREGESINWE